MKIQLTDKGRARIRVLLIAGSILAALKCILVGIQVDEEYAVSMSYRMLLGDRLFAEIWDPHQTSAFLMEFFLWHIPDVKREYFRILQLPAGDSLF